MPPRTPTASLFATETSPTLPAEVRRRTPEKAVWINAHCDGGARGNPGPAGFGAQIEDDDGNTLAELSEFLGVRTNNYAEYAGLLGCLAWALQHQHPRLRVVSDSELMVKQIQGKYQVKSRDLRPLYDEAKRRIAQLADFRIEHALRHKNKDADRLANEAMDQGMKRSPGPAVAVAAPQKSTPNAVRSEAPPAPRSFDRPTPPVAAAEVQSDAMLRGFTRDGVVHVLGSTPLPDGIFVKIIRE